MDFKNLKTGNIYKLKLSECEVFNTNTTAGLLLFTGEDDNLCQHANPNNKILSPGNIFLFFEGKRYKTNDNDMLDRFTNILKVLFDGNKWILKLTISCSCLPFEEVSKI